MDTQTYLEEVQGRKGQFIRLKWRRNVTLAAKFKRDHLVEKETEVTARTGIAYDNLATVQAGRESGELPAENAGLQKNMKWKHFPWVIEHEVTGMEYARIYVAQGKIPTVKWYLNGEPTTKDTILQFLTPSDANKERGLERSVNECFNVKLDNLEVVNG
jgi:hypothetical protein